MAISDSADAPARGILAFKVLWYAAMKDIAHQEQLVKGLILANSLFVVYGESNSGKTFFALDMALTIAAGQPWRGLRTRRGLVIYIAGEGATSVRARVLAFRIAHPELATGLPFAIVRGAVDFRSADSVAMLIATIQAAESESGEKAALVVVDTLARAMPGGDENSTQDMGEVVANADRIRGETGAAVGFIHHAGKDPSKGARGSSALRAATDTEILIEGLSGPRTATVSKQRDLEGGQRMAFELVPVGIGTDPADGTVITSCVVRHVEGTSASAPKARELRGKAQRQFVAGMRSRAEAEPERIYALDDLRRIARDMGMEKGTARSVVDAITTTPYMQTCAFGYRFTDGRVEG